MLIEQLRWSQNPSEWQMTHIPNNLFLLLLTLEIFLK